jgi:DNA-binding MarR family transcriptional regulator
MAKPHFRLAHDYEATWERFNLAFQLVETALDQRLQRESGMPHAYYRVLAALAESPRGALRMGDLAGTLHFSQSRVAHSVTALERKGWVVREQCATDRRGQIAALTEGGRGALDRAAKGRADELRRLVFDRLSPKQAARLGSLCETLVSGL